MTERIGRVSYIKAEIRMWRWYRERYPTLSFNDLKLLHEMWYRKHPKQRCFRLNKTFFLKCIRKATVALKREDIKIVELGGREGHLAFQVLRKHPEIEWLNVEVIRHKMLRKLAGYRYREHELSAQLWDEHLDISKYNVFLSSSTLEHISDSDIINLFQYLGKNKIEYLILRIYTLPKGQTWKGFRGSHLLTMGSNAIKERLGYSYRLLWEVPHVDATHIWRSFWRRKL